MKKTILVFLALMTMVVSNAHGGDYIIGEGDGLDISVWGVKELEFTVRVRPDGKITVPGLGDVSATGLTPDNLTARLTEQLKKLVKNPIVTVTVKEITNSKVYVFGGGVNPTVYDLNRRTTLLQLLCAINGAQPSADGKATVSSASSSPDYRNAYILRKGKKIKENFYKLFIEGDTAEDVVMETNDSIFIPQLLDKNIYVLGAVNNPRNIVFREGITVMEALLESGGFSKFAKQNDISIFRKEDKKDVSIPVRAKDLMKDGDLSQNVRLKPGDYVIVKEGMF